MRFGVVQVVLRAECKSGAGLVQFIIFILPVVEGDREGWQLSALQVTDVSSGSARHQFQITSENLSCNY